MRTALVDVEPPSTPMKASTSWPSVNLAASHGGTAYNFLNSSSSSGVRARPTSPEDSRILVRPTSMNVSSSSVPLKTPTSGSSLLP